MLRVDRLKTGTPPRIDAKTVDFSVMQEQPGDQPTPIFSFMGSQADHPQQISCFITHTNENTLYDQMNIRLAHQFFEESRISRDFNKADSETRIEKVDAYSVNFDFNKNIGGKNELFYGIEGVFNDINSIGIDEDIFTGVKVDGATRYPQSTWASYAVYLNTQLHLTEKLLMQTGVRFNIFQLDAVFDTTLTACGVSRCM